ncbi:MAG: Hsp70 family protein [Acidimicrobiales bacterium]
MIGKPEGIERLGGIDFGGVFAHVARSLDIALSELDPDDPNAMAAVSRLRNDCVDAKEALSSDTDATIPVLLPNLQTEVRLTRREFESVVRPSLADSIEAMRRAVASAGIEMDQVAKVLLVGGSSRIPLVAMVASDLAARLPSMLEARHRARAAYAAAAAGGDAQGPTGRAAAPVADSCSPRHATGPRDLEAAPPLSIPTRSSCAEELNPSPSPRHSRSLRRSRSRSPSRQRQSRWPRLLLRRPPSPPRKPMGVPSALTPNRCLGPNPGPNPRYERVPSEGVTAPVGNRTPMLLGLAAVVLIAAIGGYFVLKGVATTATPRPAPKPPPRHLATRRPPPRPLTETTTTAAPETNADAETQAAAEAVIAAAGVADFVSVEVVDGIASLSGEIDRSTNTEVRAAMKKDADVKAFGSDDALTVLEDDEWCGPTVRANDRYACITSAIWNGSELEVLYDTENNNEPFNVNGSYHYHVFPSETPVANSGVIAEGAESQGSIAGNPGWEVHGDPAGYVSSLFGKVGKICIRIATPQHAIESLTSGNCWPVTDES